MSNTNSKRMLFAALCAVLVAGCYEATPFPPSDGAVSDHAADAADGGETADVPSDGTTDVPSDGAADVVTCPDGETPCPGGCVDLQNDPDHCGSCDNACAWGGSTPADSERGCMDTTLGLYQMCCAGSCVTPADGACTACDAPCDVGGHCSGIWDAATAVCGFDCLSLAGGAGAPCTGDGDCAASAGGTASCLTNLGPMAFPGGYCTQTCRTAGDCGAGADCARFGRTSYCLKTCTVDGDCRTADGYVCAPLPMGGSGTYCMPPMGG